MSTCLACLCSIAIRFHTWEYKGSRDSWATRSSLRQSRTQVALSSRPLTPPASRAPPNTDTLQSRKADRTRKHPICSCQCISHPTARSYDQWDRPHCMCQCLLGLKRHSWAHSCSYVYTQERMSLLAHCWRQDASQFHSGSPSSIYRWVISSLFHLPFHRAATRAMSVARRLWSPRQSIAQAWWSAWHTCRVVTQTAGYRACTGSHQQVDPWSLQEHQVNWSHSIELKKHRRWKPLRVILAGTWTFLFVNQNYITIINKFNQKWGTCVILWYYRRV